MIISADNRKNKLTVALVFFFAASAKRIYLQIRHYLFIITHLFIYILFI